MLHFESGVHTVIVEVDLEARRQPLEIELLAAAGSQL